MISLDPLSLVGVDNYKRLLMFHISMLVELTEAYFKSVEWAVSFEKDTTKEGVLRKLSNIGMLKARLRQSLSETGTARKRKF